MTLEKVLRTIERECRENEKAFGKSYTPKWHGDHGAPMTGAMAEARGVCDCCREIRVLCRKLRRQHRISNIPAHRVK